VTRRAQAALPAVAVAVVVLASVTVAAVALADGALAGETRQPDERRAAATAADRLVSAPGLTVRDRVFEADASISSDRFGALVPPAGAADVRIRLGNRTLLAVGDPDGGVTVRRSVRIATPERIERSVDLSETETVRLAERTDRLRIAVYPGNDTNVTAVRVNDRVVLHDPEGVEGESRVGASRFEPTTLRFDAGGNATGRAVVRYLTADTRATTLEVTVDAD